MTTRKLLSRSLSSLCAIVALSAGLSLAAPSQAHAGIHLLGAVADGLGVADDDDFMDSTDDAYVAPPPTDHASTAATGARLPSTTVPAPTTTTTKPVNGIIMRDGGVCDPIRHMGC